MSIQSGKFESGQVLFPSRAPWLADLETELFAFPNGRHDDQVDSISQYLKWAAARNAVRIPVLGMVSIRKDDSPSWMTFTPHRLGKGW